MWGNSVRNFTENMQTKKIVAYPGDLAAVFLGGSPGLAGCRIDDVDATAKGGESNPIGLGHVIVVGVAGIVNDGAGRPMGTVFRM